jgi:hypothetical protein
MMKNFIYRLLLKFKNLRLQREKKVERHHLPSRRVRLKKKYSMCMITVGLNLEIKKI